MSCQACFTATDHLESESFQSLHLRGSVVVTKMGYEFCIAMFITDLRIMSVSFYVVQMCSNSKSPVKAISHCNHWNSSHLA